MVDAYTFEYDYGSETHLKEMANVWECRACQRQQAKYERGLSDGQQNPLDGEGHSKEG